MNFSDFQILPKEQAEEALSRCCGSQNWAKKMADLYPDLPLFLQAGNLSHQTQTKSAKSPFDQSSEKMRWLIEKTLSDNWFKPKILPQLHVMIWGNARGV